jgi:hypothetical protein
MPSASYPLDAVSTIWPGSASMATRTSRNCRSSSTSRMVFNVSLPATLFLRWRKKISLSEYSTEINLPYPSPASQEDLFNPPGNNSRGDVPKPQSERSHFSGGARHLLKPFSTHFAMAHELVLILSEVAIRDATLPRLLMVRGRTMTAPRVISPLSQVSRPSSSIHLVGRQPFAQMGDPCIGFRRWRIGQREMHRAKIGFGIAIAVKCDGCFSAETAKSGGRFICSRHRLLPALAVGYFRDPSSTVRGWINGRRKRRGPFATRCLCPAIHDAASCSVANPLTIVGFMPGIATSTA